MTPATKSYLVPLLDDYGANDLHIFFFSKETIFKKPSEKELRIPTPKALFGMVKGWINSL